MSELLAENTDPPACIVEEFLPVGGMSLLVAQPKAGKSTFVRNMMLAVSRGEPFLNRQTTRTNIVYFALEESIAHVAYEFRRLGATDDCILARVGRIPKPSVIELLQSDIVQHKAGLAVVDPLFDALRVDDSNSYAAMNEALKEVLYVARETRCHIMVLHHTNKRDVHGGASVLGSQAAPGATDHNAFLTLRRDGTRLFESQARVGTPFELTTLGFDEETHRIWLADNLREAKVAVLAEEMFKALGKSALSITDWRAKVRGRNVDKGEAIRQLEQQGKVTKVTEGRSTMWKQAA